MLLLRFDAKKTVGIFHRLISLNFCQDSNLLAKRLTKNIVNARNDVQLQKLINKYHGSFNLFNISALLKKLNANVQRNESLLDLAYKQVLLSVSGIKKPNMVNSRAIANIIGYTGNQSYHGIDQYIKSIDLNQLLKFTNEKQFVMVFTGLLKLNLLQSLVNDKNLTQFLVRHVNEKFGCGLLISIWRNLIKHNKSNSQINKLFASKISSSSLSQQIKDFGYLVYCYTQTYSTFESAKLLKTIEKFSQNILYSTRVNIFQLCILVDHLTKLSQIAKMKADHDFIQLLQHHYLRIIKGSNLDLRSLANGFLSFHNFIHKVDSEIHKLTCQKFFQILTKQAQKIEDYESITSLFLQLITTTKEQEKLSQQNQSKQRIKGLLNPILEVFLGKNKKIMEVPDKQFQKLLYDLSLYKKLFPTVELNKNQLQLISESTIARNDLNQKQVSSIIIILGQLNVKNQKACIHLQQVGKQRLKQKEDENLHKLISRPCILGYKHQNCIKCTKH